MNNKPYTQSEFIGKMKIVNPSIEILGEYVNSHSRIMVKCLKCGNNWSPKAYQLIQGHGCPECGKKIAVDNRKGKTAKKTKEQFIQELGIIAPNIKVLGEYKNTHFPILVKDISCNHKAWKARPYALLKGVGCPECGKIKAAKANTRTNKEFMDAVNGISPSIKIIGEYAGAKRRIDVECGVCGRKWKPISSSLLSGKGCPHCSKVNGARKNTGKTGFKGDDSFRKELLIIHPNIEALEQYSGNKSRIRFHCKRCNHTWQAKPYSVLQGHGCPRCVKSGTSFMEQFILTSFKHALGDASVLSRDKSLIGLEIDIYIPSLNLAIEPGSWVLHEKSLKRDLMKRDLCKNNGVRLITIYDKYPLDRAAPFGSDCVVFSGDYNREDHKYIKSLVSELFSMAGIKREFSEDEWGEIEKESYGNSLSKTNDIFLKELADVHPNIKPLEEYVNANKRILVECGVCGYRWFAVPANLLSGDGCKKCGNKKAHEKFIKTQSEFEREVAVINPDIEVIGKYVGRHSEVAARCKVCGFEWNPVAASLLRGSSHKGAKTMHRIKKDAEC